MPFGWFTEGFPENFQSVNSPNYGTLLAARPLAFHDATRTDISPGRRLRVLAAVVEPSPNGKEVLRKGGREPLLTFEEKPNYSQIMATLGREHFSNEVLRVSPSLPYYDTTVTEIPEGRRVMPSDPSLHPALQDLGYEINEDIREACFAFNDPDVWYPGVHEGIEPVTDEHVELVIWALQRELNRELRPSTSDPYRHLPAVPLAELPARVQRALVERRRLRYTEYGITSEGWRNNHWSLWDIPEDAEWVPRRASRLAVS